MRFWEMLVQAFAGLGKWRGVLVMAFSAIIFMGLIGCLSGCAAGLRPLYPQATPNLFITTTFGPDRRLWRLRPTADTLYTEYSSDLGQTLQYTCSSQQATATPQGHSGGQAPTGGGPLGAHLCNLLCGRALSRDHLFQLLGG